MFTKALHDGFVYNRRMDLLSDIISRQLKNGAKVLDIGCGDGKIDKLIMQKKDVDIYGVDVLVRGTTYISVQEYDGERLPYEDNSFDTIIFIDVLHHIKTPFTIMQEAARVAKSNIIIKDHFKKGILAYSTLKFMDYVGNAHYGVNLPYNYMTEIEWEQLFNQLNLTVAQRKESYQTNLHLYPFPFNLIFDRNLHFIADLTISKRNAANED